jgi:hypothetical protein
MYQKICPVRPVDKLEEQRVRIKDLSREMKYLHDNRFKVLTVNDLWYDTKNNFLYIKPSVAPLTDYRQAADAIHIILCTL